MSLTNTKIIINLVSMQIVVVFHEFPSSMIKYVKIFHFKPLKINLNIILKTEVFGIYNYILIELRYHIFVKNIIVSHLNIYIIVKVDF